MWSPVITPTSIEPGCLVLPCEESLEGATVGSLVESPEGVTEESPEDANVESPEGAAETSPEGAAETSPEGAEYANSGRGSLLMVGVTDQDDYHDHADSIACNKAVSDWQQRRLAVQFRDGCVLAAWVE